MTQKHLTFLTCPQFWAIFLLTWQRAFNNSAVSSFLLKIGLETAETLKMRLVILLREGLYLYLYLSIFFSLVLSLFFSVLPSFSLCDLCLSLSLLFLSLSLSLSICFSVLPPSLSRSLSLSLCISLCSPLSLLFDLVFLSLSLTISLYPFLSFNLSHYVLLAQTPNSDSKTRPTLNLSTEVKVWPSLTFHPNSRVTPPNPNFQSRS